MAVRGGSKTCMNSTVFWARNDCMGERQETIHTACECGKFPFISLIQNLCGANIVLVCCLYSHYIIAWELFPVTVHGSLLDISYRQSDMCTESCILITIPYCEATLF